MENINLANSVGRRKTAVARVYMRSGSGKIVVNGKDISEFFTNPLLVSMINQPIMITQNVGKFDFVVNVKGGGLSGQAGAVRLGIARALLKNSGDDAEFKKLLSSEGLLTRDSRMVERKKFGQRGARKKFQFSKR
ncbi:MAG TPA: 30S ribosomal protein S9 [Spirochaetaceae bacterium]|nr:30S ribosomal protein S9 [Spirochaetaceae bacterium]